MPTSRGLNSGSLEPLAPLRLSPAGYFEESKPGLGAGDVVYGRRDYQDDRGAFGNIGIRIRALDRRREVFMTGTRLAGLVLPERPAMFGVASHSKVNLARGPIPSAVRLAPRRRPSCTCPIDVSHGSSRLADRLRRTVEPAPRSCTQIGITSGAAAPDQ